MAGCPGPRRPGAAAGQGGAVLLSDPLEALHALPGVAEACAAARDEVDALLWDRGVRARATDVARRSLEIGARDTAALEGAEVSPAAFAAGAAAEDSPLGRALDAARGVVADIPRQVDAWQRAPLQVIAGLHLIAARDFDGIDDRGRPRRDDAVVDPLHIGPPPPVVEIAPRLDALAEVLTRPTRAPAVLVAAVAHGELLALRPFRIGSGLIARAAVRLVLAARGVDPDCLSIPESGMLARGRPAYVSALRGYASGSPAGMAEWLTWNATAIGYGAVLARGDG